MQILVHLHGNKTNFPFKGFALGQLTLKQRQKATRQQGIICSQLSAVFSMCLEIHLAEVAWVIPTNLENIR